MARGETREEALFHAQDCLAAAMEACQAVEKPGSACQPAPGPQPGRRKVTHRPGDRSGGLLSEPPFLPVQGVFQQPDMSGSGVTFPKHRFAKAGSESSFRHRKRPSGRLCACKRSQGSDRPGPETRASGIARHGGGRAGVWCRRAGPCPVDLPHHCLSGFAEGLSEESRHRMRSRPLVAYGAPERPKMRPLRHPVPPRSLNSRNFTIPERIFGDGERRGTAEHSAASANCAAILQTSAAERQLPLRPPAFRA